ncbi:TRAP dicarboxylate transporter, DctP subunit [Spirochaeta thermophila DSM 6578]|uniref:TRAP dicarboxylate transporter, DctP subunit n=1 Tax=Winmispira thermophila (strain ATCC 700085 / DSM 6578 / Z-1203) TaxID=869211 RepID=G0GFK0_WINT7|nr:C4-dicarboxylate TRAP transporter substrate-binding protein [Spirochaeta thermophila]AEJ62399.1 TRAP dicarboxylate transporter, DctP subunit [Spirochaeta thermophila DSM 6578]
MTRRMACFVLMVSLAGMSLWGSGAPEETKTYKLMVGMVVTESDPMYKGAVEFKKNVEARTEGRVKVEVYPNSQLGDTRDMMEQVKAGANVAVITDPARLAESVPEIGILGAPYIVDDFQEARKLVTSSLFSTWAEELAGHGYRILSFNWYQGARHFLTNKPVKVPQDLKGLRIRTPGATVFQESIKAMGASPVALAWSEVYPAIQQKVIDGAEAQFPAVVGARLHEVIKYITKTGHFQLITGLVCSESWFKGLPEAYRRILLEEALKAGDYASQLTMEGLKENESFLKSQGVEILEVDITPFKQACEAVYDKIEGYRALREEVMKVLGKR